MKIMKSLLATIMNKEEYEYKTAWIRFFLSSLIFIKNIYILKIVYIQIIKNIEKLGIIQKKNILFDNYKIIVIYNWVGLFI